ncbi:hypothetical protein [Pseudomonas haemolytica]|uniref:Uncharacterized protein n=1 Tax=Pseudomonas haemolytica TaxID=2600065 RepID=A0ABS1GRH3_9PSED|nr:hypothetical protein [Pseudomonas haemolytica]MBK3459244.1 hypothetical protein [Pseudomonas haemolytica]
MGKALAFLGVVVSILYFGFVSWLISGKISGLGDLELNNVGDFLAGVFGPLAVLWLVLGFFQQGIELRQGTQALNLQAIELQASVEQQKELVAISAVQFDMAKRNAELEHERLASSIEPKFSLNYIKRREVVNTVMFSFELTNGGHSVTCIDLFMLDYLNVKLPILKSGEMYPIVVKVNEQDRDVVSELTVTYLNGLEQEKTKRFILHLKRGLAGGWSGSVDVPQGEYI